jgi:hypothetical protein
MPDTRLLLAAGDSERGYRQPAWASVVSSRFPVAVVFDGVGST